MSALFWAAAILALLFGVTPFYLSFKFLSSVRRNAARFPRDYAPMASVIIPCKGTDLEFEKNILSLLNQDYPAVEFLFVTATSDDPAYGELGRILRQAAPRANARLLTAGIQPGRAQKMTNMLKGVDSAAAASEVFVFLDADIRGYPSLLREHIRPLQEERIGAVTGWPFFLPQRRRLGSLLKTLWGIGGLLTVADEARNMASGAVSFIRRDTFEKAGIRQTLQHTASDSMAITVNLRRLQRRIVFRNLAVTVDDSSLRQTLQWTNRMAIFTRVYNRPFWRFVFLSYSFANLILILCVCGLLLGLTGVAPSLLSPALAMLGLPALQVLHGVVTSYIVRDLLATHYPAEQARFWSMRWSLCLLAPLAGLLILCNSLYALTTNVIVWRGIRYRLHSSSELEVLDPVKTD